MSTNHQTSGLESFHSVVLEFAPKLRAFTYRGMLIRQMLAGVHYNENSSRAIATSPDGTRKFRVVFPKYKKEGEYSVRRVKTKATYDYINTFLERLLSLTKEELENLGVAYNTLPVPLPLNSNCVRPNIFEITYATRFSSR